MNSSRVSAQETMRITEITLGRNASTLGIGQARPDLSWRFDNTDSINNWVQEGYEVKINRANGEKVFKVDSDQSVHVPWPDVDLASKEKFTVSVRARGDGKWTEWASVQGQVAMLSNAEWSSKFITTDIAPPTAVPRRPFYVRKSFKLDKAGLERIKKEGAQVYATALGVYDLYINGKRCGDHVLAPGWQSYNHRLHYQTYTVDAAHIREGDNIIGAEVGEGWFVGRLTWAKNRRNIYGEEIGLRVELDLGKGTVLSDDSWEWAYGPRLSSELYDGESFDVKLVDDWCSTHSKLSWRSVKATAWPSKAKLIAPEAPPIRTTDTLAPVEKLTSPSGTTILDFGQNLVGWLKIHKLPAAKTSESVVILRFAEVLEKGEIGMRPLRSAKATDTIYLGDQEIGWEPAFTTHGFRYVEIVGMDVEIDNFSARVIHSDLNRLGKFQCSHELVNQLHRNVVWGLRGNFCGLPTDCPQRDERLGWTGDIQVFTPTASFLYDTSGFLSNWMHDLHVETINEGKGVPPIVSPDVLGGRDMPHGAFPQSVWCDAITLVPGALHRAYGDDTILREVYDGMTAWLDKGVPRAKTGLWDTPLDFFQFGDWLDPAAPPDDAAKAMTDPAFVADAYLVGVTRATSGIAKAIGNDADSKRYADDHQRLRKAFREQYVTKNGRLASDAQTAYVLALQWDLLDEDQVDNAVERLVRLISKNGFRIGTGFAGTPVILQLLAKHGKLQVAYRMLQEKTCPSWLYPITMGATTIWERWDSMLPNGDINPGEMTSFNHYALGAVADFLHTVIGGISPLEPGWKKIRVQPQPGGTVTSAKVSHLSPYGLVSCEWTLSDGKLDVHLQVPPNTLAEVVLSNINETVGSGKHYWNVSYEVDEWPPKKPKQFGQKEPVNTIAA